VLVVPKIRWCGTVLEKRGSWHGIGSFYIIYNSSFHIKYMSIPWVPTKFQTILNDQLILVVEKQEQNRNQHSISTLQARKCGCDAPAPTSSQIGCFRIWPDLRTFYEESMALKRDQLKIIRIYQSPEEDQLCHNVQGTPLCSVNTAGVPMEAQEYLFSDKLATLHVFAEQTDHQPGGLYTSRLSSINRASDECHWLRYCLCMKIYS
jgi:hypothetical protein